MVYRNNTKKNEKIEGNAYVNFCTGLRLVSNLQIGEIACKFEIGEMVSKIGGKIWTCKFINLLANSGLRGHSNKGTPGSDQQ
jgi:hypothetical protein